MACNYVFKIDRIAHNSCNNSTHFVEFSIHSSLLETEPSLLWIGWRFTGCFEKLLGSLKKDVKYLVFTDAKGTNILIDTWTDLYTLIHLNHKKAIMITNVEIGLSTVEWPLESSSDSLEVIQEKLKVTIQQKDAEILRLSDRIKVLESALSANKDVKYGPDAHILGLLEKMETRMNKQDAEIKHHSDIIRILNESRITKSSPDGVPPALLPTSFKTGIYPKEPTNTVIETDSAMQGYSDDDDDEDDDDEDDDDGMIFKLGPIESNVESSTGKPILSDETFIPRSASEAEDALIALSIERMMLYGYTDEGGWLTRLVKAKKGDLNAVFKIFDK